MTLNMKLAEERAEGRIEEHIRLRRKDKKKDNEILSELMEHFNLSKKEAQVKLDEYDNNNCKNATSSV